MSTSEENEIKKMQSELKQIIDNVHKENGTCLYSENGKPCEEKAISSHTVSKFMLKKFTESGNVYCMSPFIDKVDPCMNINLKLTPIANASTYYIFCEKHDNKIFEDIEKIKLNNITDINQKVALLLGYRAVVTDLHIKNYYIKKKAFELSRDIDIAVGCNSKSEDYKHEDRIKKIIGKLIVMKKKIEKYLSNENYNLAKYFAISFKNTTNILCNTTIPIIYQPGQEAVITMNIISHENLNVVIFQCLDNELYIIKLLENHIKKYGYDYITKLTFMHGENTMINPYWWNNLSEDIKNKLRNSVSMEDYNRRIFLESPTNYGGFEKLEIIKNFD